MIFTTALNFETLIALVLLICTVVAKHFGHLRLGELRLASWSVPLIVTLIYLILMGFITILALAAIAALVLLSYLSKSSTKVYAQWAFGALAVCLFLALGFKLMPGFNNQLLIDEQILKANSLPFYLSLNFDKTLAGIILYLLWMPDQTQYITRKPFLLTLGVSFGATVVVLGLGSLQGMIAPSFTFHFGFAFFALFTLMQIFSTCLTEEVFFRGFIQEKLYRLLPNNRPYQSLGPLFIASTLFGLVHFAGGLFFVFYATLAGLGYGLVYQMTRKVEFAVIAHAMLNLMHLLLFTYPLMKVAE